MLRVELDISDLVSFQGLEAKAKETMSGAARDLTAAAHGHLVEEASKKLKTRRQMYVRGLSYFRVNDSTWVLNLDAKVRWIDDGMEKRSMIDDLLSSPKAKTAKDGSRYLSVPFRHGPGAGATQVTPAQASLVATIKSELKKRDIPYGKIERDQGGKVKLGRLHSFSISDAPLKTGDGPEQGKGPIGAVKQGPTGVPFLQGVSVFQRLIKQPGGLHRVSRDIMTFRMVSSKHKNEGRWEHPGLKPTNLMEETLKWAQTQWETEIGPKLVAKLIATLD